MNERTAVRAPRPVTGAYAAYSERAANTPTPARNASRREPVTQPGDTVRGRFGNGLLLVLATFAIVGMIVIDFMVLFPNGFDAMLRSLGKLQLGGYGTTAVANGQHAVGIVRGLSPLVWVAIAGTAAAITIASGVIIIARRVQSRRALVRHKSSVAQRSVRRPSPSSSKVLTLATRGETRAEIARRTGLSQDAVNIMLRASMESPAARKKLPKAAESSARTTSAARRPAVISRLA